jgi:hypothetical protein
MRPAVPQAIPRMDRFNLALALTLTPGCSTVPRAERVMLVRLRSSTAITPWFLASWVVVL